MRYAARPARLENPPDARGSSRTSRLKGKTFRRGEILVTGMTRPEFVPLMKLAAGIVTDEGGITCHAAIVSRELGIPCVIGTRIASRIIKDGDMVEVDAEKGIVRIIARTASDSNIELALKYLDLIGSSRLSPPLNNCSAFLLGSEFNTKRYFQEWYKDQVKFHALILMKDHLWQMWVPEDVHKDSAVYGFKEYLTDPSAFRRRPDLLARNIKRINQIYTSYTYKKISESDYTELFNLTEEIRDLIWKANAAVFCSIIFDRDLCKSMIEKSEIHISPEGLDLIWEKAIIPSFESFDTQQALDVLEELHKKPDLAALSEKCQYILADYHSSKTLKEVEAEIKTRYAEFIADPKKIPGWLSETSRVSLQKREAFKQWLKTLTEDERIIVSFVQEVMEIRDSRKNFIAKGFTIIYRIAERMFSEAGLSRDLIPYYTVRELIKGPTYLEANKENVKQRVKGFQYLISYDGQVEMKNCQIEDSVGLMNKTFLGSGAGEKKNEIRGQTGSRGTAKGHARVVLDIYSDHGFKKGEILVTGMTRPEFVPLMKLAAGIVTDEGGITCHAAIVSRELGIPCVIGTRIASRIIKDGDMVEVDADDGVVRIINSSQSLINKIPTIYETIVATKDWLILNGAEVPYIAGYVLKQFTSGIHRTYPEYPFITLACLHGTKEGSDGQFVLNNKEYRDSAVYLFDHLEALDRLYDDFVKAEEKLTELIQQLQNKDDEYLHTHYDQFLKLYDSEYIAAGPIDGFLVYSDEFLERMKKKYPGKDKQIACLVEPYGNTFLTDHTIGLHEIAITLKKSGKKPASSQELLGDNALRAKIESHKKKFFWIQNNYKDVQPLQIEFFADQAFELSKQELSCLEKNLSDLKRRSVSHQKECQSIEEKGIFEKDDCTKLSWLGKMALVDRPTQEIQPYRQLSHRATSWIPVQNQRSALRGRRLPAPGRV